MQKIQPRPIELEVNRFTNRWALYAWQVSVRPQPIIDWSSIGHRLGNKDY